MAPQTGVLSFAQIKTYAAAAGWKGDDLNTATAVAFAESSGDPKAKNFVPCYGLWQVNMRGSMGPARRKKYGLKADTDLYDPATNARVAYGIWQDAGNSFKPWTTYTGGTYKKYLPQAQKATTAQQVGEATEKVNQVVDENMSIAGMVNNAMRTLTETFRQSFLTYIVVVVAIVLVILGIMIINRQQITKVATTAAKVVV